jgi:hypothetical protein
MKKITKQNKGERTVRITGKVFRGNFTAPTIFNSQQKTMWGMSLFYWILIGTVSGAVLVLIIIAGLCGYKLNKKSSEAGVGQTAPGINTFVHNAIAFHPGSSF